MSASARKPGIEMFDLATVPAVPWKNNRGLTRVVTTQERDGEVLWRVSVADIGAPGPFSLFPETDRHSALLAGDGLMLEGEGTRLIFAACGNMHAYAGEMPLSARLGSAPARLLNVMTLRGSAACRMQRHVGASPQFTAPQGAVLVTDGSFGLFQGDDYLTQVHAQQGLIIHTGAGAVGMRLVPNSSTSTMISMQIDLQ